MSDTERLAAIEALWTDGNADTPSDIAYLIASLKAAQEEAHHVRVLFCKAPVERPATPWEVDHGCELGISYDPCGACQSCRLAGVSRDE